MKKSQTYHTISPVNMNDRALQQIKIWVYYFILIIFNK